MSRVLDFVEGVLTVYLKELIDGGCPAEDKSYDYVKFSRTVGEDTFVLVVYVHDEHRCVALTNLLCTPTMKRKGVSIEILNILVHICCKVGYGCIVTEIVNEGWMESLIKHGAYKFTEEDIEIDIEKWVSLNKPKQLRFDVVGDELIVDKEVEQYREQKEKCVEAVTQLFSSWETEIKVKQVKGYIEEIRAEKGEETYGVKFNYYAVQRMIALISNNQLEEELRNSGFIGYRFM